MLELRQYLRPQPVPAAVIGDYPGLRRGLFGRLTRADAALADEARDDEPCESPSERRLRRLRADAHAAYRMAEDAGPAALDPALAVMEGEIARLRCAVETYGEALKTLQIYGNDAGQRAVAADALRAAPVELRASAPVPRGVRLRTDV